MGDDATDTGRRLRRLDDLEIARTASPVALAVGGAVSGLVLAASGDRLLPAAVAGVLAWALAVVVIEGALRRNFPPWP